MTKYVAVIDQGTTSTRCMVFNKQGEIVAQHQLEHEQICPQAGWVEHDPLEIWERTKDVIHGSVAKAGLVAADIAAIGITNQRETTMIWNRKTGQPYGNAIVWQDTRTDIVCNQMSAEGGQNRFQAKTGLPLATYFSGPKIRWMLDHYPGLRQDAEKGEALFGNMDSWLIWKLTGGPGPAAVHVTDVTNASRTMLMNLKTLDWDEELLSAFAIPRAMLPSIRPSSDPEFYGFTRQDGPFGGEIPICGDLGDQQAATVGQVCFDAGEAKNTYGTGCFMLMNTGTEMVHSNHGLLTTVCYQFGHEKPHYALEGSVAIAGALVQWLRDRMRVINTAADIENLAKLVPDNGGMYFVPAFSGLFAPYWRSEARGLIIGMTRFINRGHFARASLEAAAYQTREVVDAMQADSNVSLKVLKVDGGMTANDLLMQIQADVLGVPVVRPKVAESTALGAAYAAGLAIGYWKNSDDLCQNWGVDKSWKPSGDDTLRTKNYAMWKKAVTRTFDWLDESA
ncbi:glycerol kinase GlpK [Beijerinckia indica]|uniref:Glycerol kinase n=1 Tax=Beijerinckia indica subsp. indica (strain ATCC 9039 / DSM 1715 / NCIMB 8712) TaxID=395963 RepID=GLPK_BEII9|nr:glycerol kinase GlpK [Beijerinckia indica]B2IE09.1 RecName: Full=Glycerol kinase; AltName: Full=ATP:glycerol 3-phosphotransferase; AltName: Full=Glycerokinase; Short=GK [Beijerinckia indica subsp. indica ATCC 9039]ACB94033.1 glycerol kinase [Beijerinckia indica subsp. indica ATCC 9039]